MYPQAAAMRVVNTSGVSSGSEGVPAGPTRAVTYQLTTTSQPNGPQVVGGSIECSFTGENGKQIVELVPLVRWSKTVNLPYGKLYTFAVRSADDTPVMIYLEVDMDGLVWQYKRDEMTEPSMEIQGEVPSQYDKIEAHSN